MKSSNNILIAGIAIAVLGYLTIPSVSASLTAHSAFALGAIASTLVSVFVLKFTANHAASPLNENTDIDASASLTDTSTLYVGNLPYKANEMDVQKLFEQYGSVVSVRLMKDRYTGKRRGFGFIVMDAANAETAIEKLNGSEFGQRSLKVKEANEPKPRDKEKNIPA